MRVGETPQQARPKGAERLHMAFQGLFADQDGDAWVPRASKADSSRFGVATGSTRTTAQSSRTSNVLRRSAQGPSVHDRTASPADKFLSPTRGVKKNASAVKSPVGPQGDVNRHTNRPVYTAVGISTPTVPNMSLMSKSATSGTRASGSTTSPGRQRRTQQRQQAQQLQPAVQDANTKPSPTKGASVGSTTSAVIAALAMDAALPDLDATAMAMLETIMAGVGTPSPCQSPSFNYLAPAVVTPVKTPASTAVRSPLGPVAKSAKVPMSPSRLGTAGAAAMGPEDATGPAQLTQQLLQQHQQQFSQTQRQQTQHPTAGAQNVVATCGGSEATSASASASRQRSLQMQMQSPKTQQSRMPSSPRSHYAPVQQQVQFGTGASGPVWGISGGAGRKLKTSATQSLPADHPSVLSPHVQELSRPPAQAQPQQPQMHQQGLPIPSGGSFLTSGEMGADAKPHPAEESLQARTCRLLAHASDSPSAHRPAGSHSATHFHDTASAAASNAASGGGTALVSPGSRAVMKRLYRSHLAGSLSSRTLKSPKDEPRRPTTYAELQGTSRLHHGQYHQHERPSTAGQPQQQDLQRSSRSSLPVTAVPFSEAQDSNNNRKLMTSGDASIATATGERTDGPLNQPGINEIAVASEGPASRRSCTDMDRLSMPSSAAATACTSPSGRFPSGNGSNGRFPSGPGLALPEAIAERGVMGLKPKKLQKSRSQQQAVLRQREEQQDSVAAPKRSGDAGSPPAHAKANPKRGAGLLGGLFSCFGFAGASAKPSSGTLTLPIEDVTVDDGEEVQPATEVMSSVEEKVMTADPPSAPAPVVPEPVKHPQIHVPLKTTSPYVPIKTVAAVAAALSISPTSAAAHVGADSRLLMLLQAELATMRPAACTAELASGSSPPSRATTGVAADATDKTKGNPASTQQHPQSLAEGNLGGVSPCTPRPSGGGAASSGGQQLETLPAPAVQALQSKSPSLPGLGNRQPPGMMPCSPDAPGNAISASRSPIGPTHLRHEDGDSVLRGSVDVHPTVASSLSFSPAVPMSRPQTYTRVCSVVPTGGVRPGQPLNVALEAAATAGNGGGNGVSFPEPTKPESHDTALGAPAPLLEQPLGPCLDLGLGLTSQPPLPGPKVHANPQGQMLQRLADDNAETMCMNLSISDSTAGASTALVPALPISGPCDPVGSTTPQAQRSNRKRSRATHAGFSSSALSQLDARKLAAMPLEEMLEQIQAAIVAEDLATGRTPQHGTSGGGLSDDGSILPMPPVMAKARSGSLRRRKSTAGGRATGAGLHSGGGGGGNPSRGGRSSDGGTRGGAAGVGTVQTTLMKAASTAALLGNGRRRRRVKNRSPAAARRRQLLASNNALPTTQLYYFHGSQAVPVSPYGRRSDGAGNASQPVWRHGGRALAFNGFGFAGSTSSISPRISGYDSFVRQPPYKKPQLSTPGALPSVMPPGLISANPSYGGVTGGGAGGSPSLLRASLTMSPPPPIAIAKSPVPVRAPGVSHAHIRAARRILDVDDAPVPRAPGYSATLVSTSSSLKDVSPNITTKKETPPDVLSAPVTSCLNISELLSRCNTNVIAQSAGGALTMAMPADRFSTCGVVPNALGRPKKQHQRADRRSECIICRGVATMGGAIPIVASDLAPSKDTVLRGEAPVTMASLTTSAPPEDAVQVRTSGDDNSSESYKPRVVSVSLTELFRQVAGQSGDYVSGGGPNSNLAAGAPGSGMVVPRREGRRSAGGAVKSTHAMEQATAAAAPAIAVAASMPGLPCRQELRASKGALLPHTLAARSSGGGCEERVGTEPARSPVGYLELLQAYGQVIGSRAAALPHYAMPISSRGTSAAGGGSNGSAAGRTSTTELEAHGGDSNPLSSPLGRSAACIVSGRLATGSYAQTAALRPCTPAAAAVVSSAAGKAAAVQLLEPIYCDATNAPNGTNADVGIPLGLALVDAANATASPTHGPDALTASSSTSSVLAQAPSTVKQEGTEGLESTTAVRGGSTRLLEDTANSGGSSDTMSSIKLDAATAVDADDITACGGGSNSARMESCGSALQKEVESGEMDGIREDLTPTPSELLLVVSSRLKYVSGASRTTEEVPSMIRELPMRPPSPSENGVLQPPSTTEDAVAQPPPSTERLAILLQSLTEDAVLPQPPSPTEDTGVQSPAPTERLAPLPQSLTEDAVLPQPPAPTEDTGVQSLPPAEEAMVQLPPPAEEAVAQSLPPTEEEAVQSPPPTEEEVVQSLPPAEEAMVQLPPPAEEAVAQSLPPTEEEVVQSPPPTEDTGVQSLPPAEEAMVQLPPPAEEAVAQSLPPTEEAVQSPPPTEEEVVQSLPSTEEAMVQSSPPTDDAAMQPTPLPSPGPVSHMTLRRQSGTPFGDWRCVPFEACERSLDENDVILGTFTVSDDI
ncbi:hypothetical protein Vafri_10645 [Volvox africanus]|uniref:Uncharacterized protein n=1 Tax=Volvox africanus TaxID=51714 RepID=A0A8J4B699_9CHLO|nr:hypothetical protein Vafri_10645 [Volvox africanus]